MVTDNTQKKVNDDQDFGNVSTGQRDDDVPCKLCGRVRVYLFDRLGGLGKRDLRAYSGRCSRLGHIRLLNWVASTAPLSLVSMHRFGHRRISSGPDRVPCVCGCSVKKNTV